jgi:hypothetical protein
MPAVVLGYLILITAGFVGWISAIITAIQDESIVLVLLSIFLAPLASLYGLYLYF